MRQKSYSTDLKEQEWAVLKPMMETQLAKQDPRGRKLGHELRELVNAVR